MPFLISTLYYNITLNQYEQIIENVYNANSLSRVVQDEIDPTIWKVVSGKTKFEDNTQYELINRIKERLDELEKNANSGENGYLIEVARNTLETLESYVVKIGENIESNRPVRENEAILGEIRSVSDYDIIQQFVASKWRSHTYRTHGSNGRLIYDNLSDRGSGSDHVVSFQELLATQ